MIDVRDGTGALSFESGASGEVPFGDRQALRKLCFVHLEEGREGPHTDQVCVRSLDPTAGNEGWKEERVCLGESGAPAELAAFLEGRAVITSGSSKLEARAGELLPGPGPSRLACEDFERLFGVAPEGRPEEEPAPSCHGRLHRALVRVLARDPARKAVIAHTFGPARSALEREGQPACAHLGLFLSLMEHASALDPHLDDGSLSRAVHDFPSLEDALEEVRPRWTIQRDARNDGGDADEPLGVLSSEEWQLDERDRARVDDVFRLHLPRVLTEARGVEACYREGQHGVAARIADGFGRRELRLIYAPTGTGKTLAYLVPAMLWALRTGIRVGVATFTRALQEQAMEREVPLARELLIRAGVGQEIRVSVLKGRANYLCWRALLLQVPALDDSAVEQLAWASLVDFALRDETGDLDRHRRVRPLHTLDVAEWNAADQRFLRLVRAESGCCSFAGDRLTCAANAARHRAERAHVVITNHAFALARREFFKHLVFDECEHLHDVAQNAFSHTVALRSLRELLGRFYGNETRRPLNRISSLTPPESEMGLICRSAIEARWRAGEAAMDLGDALGDFKRWRTDAMRARTDRDQHSLFREYVTEEPQATGLMNTHAILSTSLGQLAACCAQMSELLESTIPPRELSRLRRTLEVLRLELDEVAEGVDAWIPRGDQGAARFRDETFYDVEQNAMGEDLLAARVLLPHEFLGRRYYPDLGGAVLLSATTWLKQGFDASATFLGLARATEPAPEEEREPTLVETFRAPEAFDYSRVCVCVPRDAPSVRDKFEFLGYTGRFLQRLAEHTRGRMLVLFTNAEDLARTGRALEPWFEAEGIPFWWQRMSGTSKEELTELFRRERDSVLLGLDTFWYGADFPGETLEHLVLVRLPYGVPDRYHHAQCAALGVGSQRNQIYMPRALAKYRQGFGRLMRRESDKGAVYCLDKRVLDPRHRAFLKELPVRSPFDSEAQGGADADRRAPLFVGDTSSCIERALGHIDHPSL